jgi:transposase-like protein
MPKGDYRRQKRYPQETIDRALEMYQGGWRRTTICQTLGISPTSLQNWLTEAGIPLLRNTTRENHFRGRVNRTKNPKRTMYTLAQVDEAIDLYLRGERIDKITEKIGCCEASIYKWLNTRGLRRREPWKGAPGTTKPAD